MSDPAFRRGAETLEVHVMDRPGSPMLGSGEASQRPASAAFANALHAATGQRLRRTPFTADPIKAAIGI